MLNYLANHKNVEGKWHMVRNLGCFRLLSDTIIKKVTSRVSIFDKREEITCDFRGIVALLEAERKCLLGPSCHPEYSRGSLLCLQDPLLCGRGNALCGREGLFLICTLSPYKEGGFFWGTWMKVIPHALIRLLKTLNLRRQYWWNTPLSLFSVVFSLLDKRKNKHYRLIQRLQYCSVFLILSVCPMLTGIFHVKGLVDLILCLF